MERWMCVRSGLCVMSGLMQDRSRAWALRLFCTGGVSVCQSVTTPDPVAWRRAPQQPVLLATTTRFPKTHRHDFYYVAARAYTRRPLRMRRNAAHDRYELRPSFCSLRTSHQFPPGSDSHKVYR